MLCNKATNGICYNCKDNASIGFFNNYDDISAFGWCCGANDRG